MGEEHQETISASTDSSVSSAPLTPAPKPQLDPAVVDLSVIERSIDLDRAANEAALSEAEAVAVATELGVSPGAIARAIAEHRVGAPEDQSLLDRLIGERKVAVHHHTGLDPDKARALVAEWLGQAYGFRVHNTSAGVVVGTRRKSVAGLLSRTTRSLRGLAGLSEASEVRAALVEYEGERVAVCLTADVTSRRRWAVAGGGAVAGVGVLAAGAGAVAIAPAAATVAPVAIGIGALVARRGGRVAAADARSELEFTADAIALGERPPSLRRSAGRAFLHRTRTPRPSRDRTNRNRGR